MALLGVCFVLLVSCSPGAPLIKIDVWAEKPQFIVIGLPLDFRLNCSATGASRLSWISEDNSTGLTGWNISGDGVSTVAMSAVMDVRKNNTHLAGAYRCVAESSSSEYVGTKSLVVNLPQTERVAVDGGQDPQPLASAPLVLQCLELDHESVVIPLSTDPLFYKRIQCISGNTVVADDCTEISLNDENGNVYLVTVGDAGSPGEAAVSENHCHVKIHPINKILLVGLLQYLKDANVGNSSLSSSYIIRSQETMSVDSIIPAVECQFTPSFSNVSVHDLTRPPELKVMFEGGLSAGVRVSLLQIVPRYQGLWSCSLGRRSVMKYSYYLNNENLHTMKDFLPDVIKYVGQSVRFECLIDQAYPPPTNHIKIVTTDLAGHEYPIFELGRFKAESKTVITATNLTRNDQRLIKCKTDLNADDIYGHGTLTVIDAPIVNLTGGDGGNFTIFVDPLSSHPSVIRFACNYTTDRAARKVDVSWVLPNRAWPARVGDHDPERGVVGVEWAEALRHSELVLAVVPENFVEAAGVYRCRVEYTVDRVVELQDIALSSPGRVTTVLVTELSLWAKFSSEWWWWVTLVGAASVIIVVVVAVVKVYPRRRRLSLTSIQKLAVNLGTQPDVTGSNKPANPGVDNAKPGKAGASNVAPSGAGADNGPEKGAAESASSRKEGGAIAADGKQPFGDTKAAAGEMPSVGNAASDRSDVASPKAAVYADARSPTSVPSSKPAADDNALAGAAGASYAGGKASAGGADAKQSRTASASGQKGRKTSSSRPVTTENRNRAPRLR